ncbi:MAG: glycosyltransferase family 2 protein [Sphingomonas sp.]
MTVTYNCERHMEPFVRSLEAQTTRDFVLVVVDNNSTDGTLAALERALERSSFESMIIRSAENLGVAAGNNAGIAAARARGTEEWVLIINNDVTFEPALVARLTEAAPAKIITSPLILAGDTDDIWYAGGYFDERRMLSTVHEKVGMPAAAFLGRAPWETEYAPTTCLAVPMRAFASAEVGAFHEDYFCYYDDADWIYQARIRGYRVFVDGTIVLRHFEGGASGGNRSAFSLYYLTRNRLIFVRRAKGVLVFASTAVALLLFVFASSVREPRPFFYLRHRLRGWAAGVLSGMKPLLGGDRHPVGRPA